MLSSTVLRRGGGTGGVLATCDTGTEGVGGRTFLRGGTGAEFDLLS